VEILGTRLGRYEVRERIGKGGMASVYKAWDTNLDRWVAVKILHEYLADEKDFKARFEREAKLVASLNHPNIVQVYDFSTLNRPEGPMYYMVMAYISGLSLRRKMEMLHESGQRLSLDEVKNVLAGVCAALSYAHGRGMMHRDVTPGNILFDEHGQAVLADFGIARMVQGTRLTQSGTTSGTPIYMAPEIGLGDAGDKRSDIYSLGVILFEMLTGSAPYEGDSAIAILMKHVNQPVPSPVEKNPSLPKPVDAVVQRAMAKDPADRYQDANDLLADYQRAISNTSETRSPVMTRVLTEAEKRQIRGTSRRPLIALAVICLVLVAAAVMVLVSQRSTGSAPTSTPAPTLGVQRMPTRKGVEAMTKSPLEFTDTFGKDRNASLDWQITTDDPDILRTIENGAYHIRNTLNNTAITALFDEDRQYPFGYVYEADITLDAASPMEAASGIVFRYQNVDAFYVFGVNAQGQVSLWARSADGWKELRGITGNWTPAEGVNPAGKLNRLKVVDDGKELIAFVNDAQVIKLSTEPLINGGAIGIYVANPSAPNSVTDVRITRFKVTRLTP